MPIISSGAFPSGSLPDYLIKKSGTLWRANSLSGVGASFQGTLPETVIQNALNALRGIGGLFQLRDNPTFTTLGVTAYPGMSLQGQGPLGVSSPVAGTSYIQASGFNTPVITVELDATTPTWASFPEIGNLSILGDTTQSGQDGILVTDTAGAVLDVYVNHVGIFNCGGNGLNVSDATGKVWVIGDSYFEHCQLNGIRNQNATVRMIGGYIFGNVLYGVDATACAYMSGLGVMFGNNGQSGTANAVGAIKAGSSGSGGLFTGCDFFDNGTSAGQAVRLTNQTGTGRWIMAHNNFKDSRGASAVPNFILTSDSGAVDALVEGNEFVGQTGDAVKVKFNNAGEAVVIRNNPGMNPYGLVASPLNATHGSCGLTGGDASPTASTTYTIRECDGTLYVSGGTAVSITVFDNKGNTMASGLTSLPGQFLPVGYAFNLGAFTGTAPTLSWYAN